MIRSAGRSAAHAPARIIGRPVRIIRSDGTSRPASLVATSSNRLSRVSSKSGSVSFSRSSAMLGAAIAAVHRARKKTSMKAVSPQTRPAYAHSASAS